MVAAIYRAVHVLILGIFISTSCIVAWRGNLPSHGNLTLDVRGIGYFTPLDNRCYAQKTTSVIIKGCKKLMEGRLQKCVQVACKTNIVIFKDSVNYVGLACNYSGVKHPFGVSGAKPWIIQRHGVLYPPRNYTNHKGVKVAFVTAPITLLPSHLHLLHLFSSHLQPTVVNKKQLVAEVAESLSKTQKEVSLVLESLLDAISRHLGDNHQVSLARFGVFHNSLRGERRMRNLQTGEEFTAKPVYVPNLRFYDALKEQVNQQLRDSSSSKGYHSSSNY